MSPDDLVVTPTAACIAFSQADLLFIATRAAPGTRVVVPAQRAP